MIDVLVEKIPPKECLPMILGTHYLRRKCPISYAFGAREKLSGRLVGIVTYGVPSSAPLRAGICGDSYASNVLELNRLVCENRKNLASLLVGRSSQMLPRPSVIVSYADIMQGHIGYVYQACNFLYTGLSAKRTDWKVRGMESLHNQSVVDISRGMVDRAKFMRERFGDDFFLKDRPRKHRYVLFIGSKYQRSCMRRALRYDVLPYPKGDGEKYAAPMPIASQSVMMFEERQQK